MMIQYNINLFGLFYHFGLNYVLFVKGRVLELWIDVLGRTVPQLVFTIRATRPTRFILTFEECIGFTFGF